METQQPNNEQMAKLIAQYIEEHYPYVKDIEDARRNLHSGLIAFTLRIYQNTLQDIVVTTTKRITYGNKE